MNPTKQEPLKHRHKMTSYFIQGGRLYHPTKNNSFVSNTSTLRSTYVAQSKLKINPSFNKFGTDSSNEQNDADETNRRRYFFPPFTIQE